jgi:hypothetical protein
VINNTINNDKTLRRRSVTIDPNTLVTYPNAEPDVRSETTIPSVQPEIEPDLSFRSTEFNELQLECELYKEIALTVSRILKSNNQKLLANLIDQSGKVIVDVTSLCVIIAKQLNVPIDSVHIEYVQKESGCLHRVSKIHDVSNIKINHVDYKWAYNEKYNILRDQFSISLTRVIA